MALVLLRCHFNSKQRKLSTHALFDANTSYCYCNTSVVIRHSDNLPLAENGRINQSQQTEQNRNFHSKGKRTHLPTKLCVNFCNLVANKKYFLIIISQLRIILINKLITTHHKNFINHLLNQNKLKITMRFLPLIALPPNTTHKFIFPPADAQLSSVVQASIYSSHWNYTISLRLQSPIPDPLLQPPYHLQRTFGSIAFIL